MSVEMMPLVLILQQLLLLVSYTAQPSECTDVGCVGEKGEPVDCSISFTMLSCQCDLCTMQGVPGVPGPPGRQVSGLFSNVLLRNLRLQNLSDIRHSMDGVCIGACWSTRSTWHCRWFWLEGKLYIDLTSQVIHWSMC